jgi:N-acetylglutamate synthase-like GNAT family acetyltransferase
MTQRSKAGLRLRAANPGDLAALTALCLRSKAVWGYDAAFMEACRDELTLTRRDLDTSQIQVAERDGVVVGVAQVSVAGAQASLDKLFVEPRMLRTGAGRELFAWCVEAARKQGARALAIEADPGAADFYHRMGAHRVGIAPSGSIPGRMLPLLKLDL